MAKLSKHDKSVVRRAAGLRANRWKVRADVSGFPKPSALRVGNKKVIPDIIAEKGKRTRIIEVETEQTWNRDREQRRLLRKYAQRKSRTEFMARRAK